MFKVVQFKVGDPLQMIFRSRLFLHENHFFVKICTSAGFLDQPLSKFQTLLRHYICPLVMGFNRRWEEGNFAKFGKISSAIGVKKCTLFIWEGRRPPWPSWQEAPSGWGPRNAWKCSLWKPSPCTAGQCRYLREQLKYEKISSENEFTVKVELSLCTGGQCHDLETKIKMKVLKNIFWAVICIIGVGWRIRMDYWDDQDDEDGGGNDNEMLTDFEINFGEVVKVRGVVNGLHLKIKMLKI